MKCRLRARAWNPAAFSNPSQSAEINQSGSLPLFNSTLGTLNASLDALFPAFTSQAATASTWGAPALQV
jgi:hypothetical protein